MEDRGFRSCYREDVSWCTHLTWLSESNQAFLFKHKRPNVIQQSYFVQKMPLMKLQKLCKAEAFEIAAVLAVFVVVLCPTSGASCVVVALVVLAFIALGKS